MNQPYRLARRDFIQVGSLGALGLSLPSLLRSAESANARATSCILIWLDGGPSHLETFDPKPDAPEEVRGPFDAVQTVIPGIYLSELLPESAKRMHDFAIVRSMTSTQGEHNFGTHYLLTGYKSTPALEYPSYGSVASHVRQVRSELPPYVAIPDMRVGGGKFSSAGYLAASSAPFEVGGDPARPDFKVDNLLPFEGITSARIDRRREFRRQLDKFRLGAESADLPDDSDFERAFRLVTSTQTREAFELEAETSSTRNRYGRKSIGQSCLLARRLVERGVPFITVNNKGWDTHNQLVTRLRDGYAGAQQPVGLIPSLDLAFSALLDDLRASGMLDETLVVVMGEFGRTPKLNTQGGRDHWPRVFSVALAGAGIQGGQVIGASDEVGESPGDRPVTPADLAATIYTLLGIDPQRTLHTSDGRPVPINQEGTVIRELVG